MYYFWNDIVQPADSDFNTLSPQLMYTNPHSMAVLIIEIVNFIGNILLGVFNGDIIAV